MSFPDEAVEVAARAIAEEASRGGIVWEDVSLGIQNTYKVDARAALSAAAPFIRARALRDYARSVKDTAPEGGMVHIDDIVENMRDDADEMERQ